MEDRPKKRKRRPAPGQQETISADQFFREITSPSYSKRPATIYLYLCPQCGWWDISNGVAEVFGDLYHHAGPRTEPCERCQYTPMYLVKRDDLLRLVIESEVQSQ